MPWGVDLRRALPDLTFSLVERSMIVRRLENGLAVELPDSVIEALHLKEGDNIELSVNANGMIEVARSREAAVERFASYGRPMPPGWKFDRNDAYVRGSED